MKKAFMGIVCLAAAVYGAEAGKPRVFVTQSDSWELKGVGRNGGGAAPQTAEIIKTFGERCPNVTITSNKERADFVATIDHEGGKGYLRRDTKVAVFNKDGDVIFSGSARTIGGGVKDACSAIIR